MTDGYNLIFTGKLLPGLDENSVKEKVAKALKLQHSQREAFFSGKEITLKKDLPLDEALRLKSQLEQAGLMMTLMSSTMANMYLSLEISQKEKAIAQQRTEAVDPAIEQRRESAKIEYEARMDQQAEDEAVWVDEPPALFSVSLTGRYGRLNYLNASIGAFIIVIVVIFLFGALFVSTTDLGRASAVSGSMIMLLSAVIYPLINLRFSILRLHDLNLSGWFLLLTFVPMIGGIFSLYLLFAKGTEGRNDYGYQPREGSKIGFVGLGLIILLMILYYK